MGVLKDLIKETELQIQSIDWSLMLLYRISPTKDNLQESLDTLNVGYLLKVTQSKPIFDCFLAVTVLEPLNIIIQVYSDMNSALIV